MDTSQKTQGFSAQSIREIAFGFQKSRILLSAFELGIFSALEESQLSPKQVADSVGADTGATRRLMDALCILGFLKKRGENFLNTPSSYNFLAKQSKNYMAGLRHYTGLWKTWSALTDAVKKGSSPLVEDLAGNDQEWFKDFIAAMHDMAVTRSDEVIALLDLNGVKQLLDIGAGSGDYTAAFLKGKSGLSATIFDLPEVIPLAKGYLGQTGILDRVNFIEGDYMTDSFGGDYDLIFLSAIVHINSFKENQALIKRCAQSLNPRGQIVIQDFIMSESRLEPSFGTLFSLNMLVSTKSGDTYTQKEISSWMIDAGLSSVIIKNTEFGTGLIIGRKT